MMKGLLILPWQKKYWTNFPWALFLTVFLLTVISLLFIQSASYNSSLGRTLPFAKKQMIRLVVSAGAFFFLAMIHRRMTEESAFTIYGLCILALLAVFVLGKSHKGAARWIPIGPIRIQPSEFMKLGLILGLAKYLKGREVTTFKSLALPFGLTLIPLMLVLKQPDLGTSLLFLPLLFCLLYVKGTPLKYLLVIALALVLCGGSAWQMDLLNKYQKNRVYAFLNPEKYSQSIAYQPIQSQIAVGSGGLWGKGLYKGSQTQLNFLPERHTDFIFSVICEEWGLIGGGFVLLLILLMVTFIFEAGARSEDEFASLLATGIGTIIAIQTFINVGIAIGIMPVTGLTLPFISYGGSSTLMFWMALGVVAQANQKGS